MKAFGHVQQSDLDNPSNTLDQYDLLKCNPSLSAKPPIP